MDVCSLRQDGEVVLHRNMQAAPEPFLKAIAPSRDDMVVAVACKHLTKNNFIFISEILEHVFDVVDQMRPAFIRI